MINKQLFFSPHLALQHVVNNIMIGHVSTEDINVAFSFSIPPLHEHSIFFFPFDKPTIKNANSNRVYELYPCTITGPQAERSIVTLGRNHLMIKIGFQPGLLHRLLRLPMQAMLQQDYDGEAVFGPGIRVVVEALACAGNFLEMIDIVNEFMLRQLGKIKKPCSIDYVIPQIIKHGGMAKIDNLVREANMSNRQFERTFKDRMGLSPKFYSRLVRFGKAWMLKEYNPNVTWTEVAYECSYFDQMHLIRDFKVFANANPKKISDDFEKHAFVVEKARL